MAEVRRSGVPAEAQCGAKVAGRHGGEPLPGLPAGVLLDGAPAPLQVSASTPSHSPQAEFSRSFPWMKHSQWSQFRDSYPLQGHLLKNVSIEIFPIQSACLGLLVTQPGFIQTHLTGYVSGA